MESLGFLNVIGNGNDLGKCSGNFCLSPRWKKNVLPIEIYHFYLPPPSHPPPHNSLNYHQCKNQMATRVLGQGVNNIGSSTMNRLNSFNVVSTLFCQGRNNVDKHTSAQLSFSTKFQRWNNVGSSTLNWHNYINVVSALSCHPWNKVKKFKSTELS